MNYPTYMQPGYPGNQAQPYPPRPDMQGYPPQCPQQPLQGPQTVQQAMQGISPSSRLVTSREEAMGVAADFSGAPMVFPDIANGRIFVKRWNFNTGSSDFTEFVPVVQAAPASAPPQMQPAAFASLQDLQDLQDLVENLQKEVERLKKPVGRAGKKNDANDE